METIDQLESLLEDEGWVVDSPGTRTATSVRYIGRVWCLGVTVCCSNLEMCLRLSVFERNATVVCGELELVLQQGDTPYDIYNSMFVLYEYIIECLVERKNTHSTLT